MLTGDSDILHGLAVAGCLPLEHLGESHYVIVIFVPSSIFVSFLEYLLEHSYNFFSLCVFVQRTSCGGVVLGKRADSSGRSNTSPARMLPYIRSHIRSTLVVSDSVMKV